MGRVSDLRHEFPAAFCDQRVDPFGGPLPQQRLEVGDPSRRHVGDDEAPVLRVGRFVGGREGVDRGAKVGEIEEGGLAR